ncbi:hypothetical protein Clacol_002891 [Clathrus columnatus]|uniref:Class II aldolase/adducin N-terminal domain-containing protein n=1 Tax=Clathrus columnatus TaxID=1419009 RepID=A0AAV5A213_9AGAM|nr:hypothetical protein Clacol_002891 [Clathrus columnatus]
MTPVAVQQSDIVSQGPIKNAPQSISDVAPISRVWRGDKAGKITLQGRPDFQGDKHAERQWIKEHMAAAFRYWGKLGYAEGLAGHITVRDPVLPGHYWMNPFCVHFSSMRASDLVLVDPEGYVTEGGAQLPINAAGFHIHTAIHKARPDIMAAAHCHSIHARTWSTMGRPIDILTQDACIFHNNLSVYKSFGGIVLAAEEGRRIAEALGPKNKAVLLQNHGSLTLGQTVDEAIHLFTALENACRVQLMAEAASVNGLSKRIIDEEDAAYTAAVLQDPDIATIPTTPDCLPIQNEAADIHPSPSDLHSCLPFLQSKIHLNELGSCTPADFKDICHENGVDNVANKETKPEDCTSGLLPLKEASCDIKLIGSIMDDGDTRYSQLENVGLITLNGRVFEPIAVDCSLKPISKEPSVDKSNISTPHLKASMAKQKCEESAPESVFPHAFDNTSTNTAKTCILSFSSAIDPSHSEMGHKTSYRVELKLEKQIGIGNAYGLEQTTNDMNDSAVTISSSRPPILTTALDPVLSVDPVTNCAEKASEFDNLDKCNLTECEAKAKRKRGCRGGVRSSKRIAARRQAAAKNELESLQCASVETSILEKSLTDSLLTDHNPFERDCVEAKSNLPVFDPSSYLRESDTSDPPITTEIQSIGAELKVDGSNTPGGKTLKPGYIRKRGCRGKRKSSKQQLQYPCDNLSPIQVEL